MSSCDNTIQYNTKFYWVNKGHRPKIHYMIFSKHTKSSDILVVVNIYDVRLHIATLLRDILYNQSGFYPCLGPVIVSCTPDRKMRCLTLGRKSYITHVISPRTYHLLLNNISFTGRHVTSSLIGRHNKARMMSVFFKMADSNAECFKVTLNLFKRKHPYACKKKNPT